MYMRVCVVREALVDFESRQAIRQRQVSCKIVVTAGRNVQLLKETEANSI